MIDEEKKKKDNGENKEETRGIVGGITKFLKMGYKFFKLDGNGDFIPKGDPVKTGSKGWPKPGKSKKKPSKQSQKEEIEDIVEIVTTEEANEAELAIKELQNQYAKILNEIKYLCSLKEDDEFSCSRLFNGEENIYRQELNQTFRRIFDHIDYFKNMVSENTEKFEGAGRLPDTNSLLKLVLSAEEILQRYYVTGMGDLASDIRRRAIAAEEHTRRMEEVKRRRDARMIEKARRRSITSNHITPEQDKENPTDKEENPAGDTDQR